MKKSLVADFQKQFKSKDQSLIFQFLQGFFVSIIFCFMNSEVLEILKKNLWRRTQIVFRDVDSATVSISILFKTKLDAMHFKTGRDSPVHRLFLLLPSKTTVKGSAGSGQGVDPLPPIAIFWN